MNWIAAEMRRDVPGEEGFLPATLVPDTRLGPDMEGTART